MKKLILFLLLPLWAMAQTSTGQEQEFDYGIKNNSAQTITTPPYLTTTGMDGTQGKIPSALIAKTSDIADSLATKENIANKSDSYTTSSSTAYVSGKALVEGLGTKQNTLTNPVTGTFVAGRVPYSSSNSTLTDSSKLLWNNTNSYFEVNGNDPRFTLKNNLNNYSTYFTNNTNGALFLKNHQDKTLAAFNNPVWSTDQPQMAIGNVSSIPAESQLYVYGGKNGANIDARGSATVDECNIDLEGNDWTTSPNSLGFSYFGSSATAFGTMLGYPKNKLGIIRFQETNYAIINSEKVAGVSPIRFGINNIEIGNVNDKGFSYQSDFSSENISNPRWLTDKGYVDTKAPVSGSTNYIQNKNDSAQSANMWINGSGKFESSNSTDQEIVSIKNNANTGGVTSAKLNFYNYNGTSVLNAAGIRTTSNSWYYGQVQPNQLNIISYGNGGTSFHINNSSNYKFMSSASGDEGAWVQLLGINGTTGAATFASTVTATSFNGSATLTGTPTAPTAAPGTTGNQIATMAALQAAITVENASNVKKTGAQSITGTKTFNNATAGQGIYSNNTSTGQGIYSNNTSAGHGILSNNTATGFGIYSSNTSTGSGIYSANASTGKGIYSDNTSTGSGITSNGTSPSTGFIYVGQNNGANTFTVDKFGNTVVNNIKPTVYTVATLPSPPVTGTGTYATVSDALAPTYMATVVGGGTVVCPVFYNGVAWVAH